jgi:hypothetical protein
MYVHVMYKHSNGRVSFRFCFYKKYFLDRIGIRQFEAHTDHMH